MTLPPEVSGAADELAQLQRQTDRERAVLIGLERDVAAAEKRLIGRGESALLEANEQLVLAMLQAHEAADIAAELLKNVARAAEIDRLTELPNRMLLLDRFKVAIANAGRHGVQLALLFVDMNKFKQINDMLGHAMGDEVLKHTARCLSASVRVTDTVSRHGGDEFLVLLTDIHDVSEVVLVAEKIIAALGVPARFGNHVLRLTASIGISLFPGDGNDAYILTDRADAAMYRAKRLGMGGFAFHAQNLVDDKYRDKAALQALLQPAIHFKLASTEPERRRAERRAADEELIVATQEAQELQAAAELAQQRQTELLAAVAHELRNPIAPLLMVAALISRVKPAELPRLQGMIERQVGRLVRLVDDLVDLARVSTGKLRLVCNVVDLNQVIAAAVEACMPAMDSRRQTFRACLPELPLLLDGDAERLTQVLSNLLDNASKYTPACGKIELVVTRHADTVDIAVIDTGIGITPHALKHVFEPFVQESHAIGFNGDGLGIGLMLVRELIESHGGTVVASSDGTGRGSTFLVTLPTLTSVPITDHPAAPPAA